MMGQLTYCTEAVRRPVLELVELYRLPVRRIKLRPDGFWAERQLKRAGSLLARNGSRRVLVPEGFARWDILKRYGLYPVDPLPFLRAHAAKLVLTGLSRQGMNPERCGVALRGVQMERELVMAAEELCPRVKDICLSVPGGEALCNGLRWEFGVAVRPDSDRVEAAVRFHPETSSEGKLVFKLFHQELDLCGISVTGRGICTNETECLPLLAALWENGRIGSSELEFT